MQINFLFIKKKNFKGNYIFQVKITGTSLFTVHKPYGMKT